MFTKKIDEINAKTIGQLCLDYQKDYPEIPLTIHEIRGIANEVFENLSIQNGVLTPDYVEKRRDLNSNYIDEEIYPAIYIEVNKIINKLTLNNKEGIKQELTNSIIEWIRLNTIF